MQNKGVDYFCEHIYPEIKDIDTNFIVNVSGSSPEDYAECAARIAELDRIPAIELNISCPNVKDGGMAFGVTCAGAASVVKAVRAKYPKTLIVKLSPNVTDIAEIARAVEAARQRQNCLFCAWAQFLCIFHTFFPSFFFFELYRIYCRYKKFTTNATNNTHPVIVISCTTDS